EVFWGIPKGLRDVITFNALLGAVEKVGGWDYALCLLCMARDFGPNA
ncbi:hypothetical protein AK812_SmicGene48153, partial [Symbiodinium microadriaticum]